MKNITIVGNWKSNKTISESEEWLRNFTGLILTKSWPANTTCVVCAPYTDLYLLKHIVKEVSLPVAIGAQDLSPYPEGAYTGQITARMLSELAEWVIIGHSERRKFFHENDDDLRSKTQKAKELGLKVIYCVSDDTMLIPPQADVIGYEPLWAIGSGKTDTPENANAVIAKIKAKSGIRSAVYGGSVTPDNVASFVSQPEIDGVLVGGASLDPEKFYSLISHAATIK